MRTYSLSLARPFVALLLASCTQGSTPVTLGGHTLTPKAGVFWSGMLSSVPTTRVVIADQRDLCDRYAAADPCAQQAQDGTPGDGAFLVITVTGQLTGTYDVASVDQSRNATLAFVLRENGAVTFTDHAGSGQVTFSDLASGASAAGRYSVKMTDGTNLQGDFTADACADYDHLVLLMAKDEPSCATSFTPTSCTTECTCSNRRNTADCSRADSASDWECSCTRSGVSSRCSVARSEANVCSQGTGCCDTSF